MNGSSEHGANQNGKAYDDLTQIEGIGTVRQRWLRENLDVYTFKDLADLSPQQIDAQLRLDRKTVAFHDIERWIAQAQELVTASTDSSSASPVNQADTQSVSEPDEPHTSHSEDSLQPSSISLSHEDTNRDEWTALASFVVEFQSRQTTDHNTEYRTLVRSLETERVRILPGLAAQQAQQWIWAQLDTQQLRSLTDESLVASAPNGHEHNATTDPHQVQTLTESTSESLPTTSICVTQVLAIQAMQPVVSMAVDASEPQMLGTLQAHKAFQPEIVFELPNFEPAHLQAHPIMHIHVYAYNRATGSIAMVGHPHHVSIEQIQPQYVVMLPPVDLQQGLYRLKVLLNLEGVPSIPGYSEIPLLQVI
jgi:hypothetical protein